MTRHPDIPVHTSDVICDLAKAPNSFNYLQHTYKLSPSTLSRILKFLRKAKFIEVVILPSLTREGMRKAYDLTAKGKKVVPMFARLKDTEKKILEMVK